LIEHAFALLQQTPCASLEKADDCAIFGRFGDAWFEESVEVPDQEIASDTVEVGAQFSYLLDLDVVFIPYFADDFLKKVLQRQDSLDPPNSSTTTAMCRCID